MFTSFEFWDTLSFLENLEKTKARDCTRPPVSRGFCFVIALLWDAKPPAKKKLRKSSHRPVREREGGISLPWVPEVKTGEFASLECENRAHRLFWNDMRWLLFCYRSSLSNLAIMMRCFTVCFSAKSCVVHGSFSIATVQADGKTQGGIGDNPEHRQEII